MLPYLIDFSIFAVLVIGMTALLGIISTTIGKKWFGRKNGDIFFNQTTRSQKGWRKMIREK